MTPKALAWRLPWTKFPFEIKLRDGGTDPALKSCGGYPMHALCHEDPDVALMLRVQAGDERAFACLFQKYRRAVVNFSRRFVGDVQRAEDAAQETFIKIYRARAAYKPCSRFRSYLFRVATNTCLNMTRRRMWSTVAPETFEGEEVDFSEHMADLAAASPEDMLAASELKEHLQNALSRLPATQREAFILLRFENMGYDEIAETMGTTVSAVRALLNRARRELISNLDSHLGGFAMPYAVTLSVAQPAAECVRAMRIGPRRSTRAMAPCAPLRMTA